MIKRPEREIVLLLIFTAVIIGSAGDLVSDFGHGADIGHVIKETMIIVASLLAMGWIFAGLRRQRREIEALQQELASRSSQPPNKYILEARRTMSSVITQQFEEWGLTDSEADVGRLLLKGLSLKEIAALRQTLEKTVRQQASSIYHKAGLAGRHAFSAWFMEDML